MRLAPATTTKPMLTKETSAFTQKTAGTWTPDNLRRPAGIAIIRNPTSIATSSTPSQLNGCPGIRIRTLITSPTSKLCRPAVGVGRSQVDANAELDPTTKVESAQRLEVRPAPANDKTDPLQPEHDVAQIANAYYHEHPYGQLGISMSYRPQRLDVCEKGSTFWAPSPGAAVASR